MGLPIMNFFKCLANEWADMRDLSSSGKEFHICGLLRPHNVAWSVCLSVCTLDTLVSPAKKAEAIEVPFVL